MNKKAQKNTTLFALLLAAFSALGPFTVDMYLASLPEIMEYFRTNASMIQSTLTASLLGLGLGQVIMGPLSDVYGRRNPLLISMILYFASSIVCAFAPNIEFFIVLRFIQGFVASAGLVISRAIVRDMYSGAEMTKFVSLLTMISNVTPLISPLAGSSVISYTSWTGVFIVLGLLGVVLTSLTIWGVVETLPQENRVPSNFRNVLSNYHVLLRNRTFMSYALGNGILFAGVFAYVSATPFIYQNIYGVSPGWFSVLFALNGVAIMLGSQLVKVLAGHMNDQRIFVIGLTSALITSAIILAVAWSHGVLFAMVASLFLFAFSIGVMGPVSFSLAMESQGHIAGSASAVLGVLPFFLGSFTSPLVGIAGEYSAKPFGIVIFTASLLSVVFYMILQKKSLKSISKEN
ncbi:multidrug effflux MFS transporter [Paenibacillus sp. FSL E2-0178]|uniref:multidrug effflux MFS transporter n=1 Tax=Paenibacillus sp. FSL E2-0178 TaxID=2921361 RepID=UPI003158DEAB